MNALIKAINLAFLLSFSILPTAFAQTSNPSHQTAISFGLSNIDRNFRIDESIFRIRHGIRFGLKYTIKRMPTDDQSFGYQNRAYPRKPLEHFGINLGYSYNCFELNNGIVGSLFYDLQLSRPSLILYNYTRTGIVLFDTLSMQNYPVYVRHKGFQSPRLIIEQHLGFALSFSSSERISLNQMVGIGILARRSDVTWNGHRQYFSFSPSWPYLRVGICWNWKKGEAD